jgi:hypothetical protein
MRKLGYETQTRMKFVEDCPVVALNLQGLLPHNKDVHKLRKKELSPMQHHILAVIPLTSNYMTT